MKLLISLTLVTTSILATSHASAQTQISTVLECLALAKDPINWPSFRVPIVFTQRKNYLDAERNFNRQRDNSAGKEVFVGDVSEQNLITITGRGAFVDRPSGWFYKFSGNVKNDTTNKISGSATDRFENKRECSITFLSSVPEYSDSKFVQERASNLPSNSDEQAKKQLADLAKELREKQAALETAQLELKKQQGTAADNLNEQRRSIQAEQDKLALAAKDLEVRQKTLESGQASLKQEQSKTSQSVSFVQNLLDGVILPTSENPESWMMRVAAVPVQQQQFCRIVDQFYDNINKVYQTRNDIKKNSLFKERQLSMAALLPRGEFANWVVQVKEVTQAADGSAAVMLQIPNHRP